MKAPQPKATGDASTYGRATALLPGEHPGRRQSPHRRCRSAAATMAAIYQKHACELTTVSPGE
jgi:hypothetical protein